jgi:hyperosmotically inducible protein
LAQSKLIHRLMKILLSFVLGVLVGVSSHWYLTQPESHRTVPDATESARNTATDFGRSVKEKIDASKIKDELEHTGRVVREKAAKAGEAIADAAANARITTTIKAKLVKETSLAALKIHVSTTDGVVTLSGMASSYEQVATAMELALDTDGVQKVICTVQVKPGETHENNS